MALLVLGCTTVAYADVKDDVAAAAKKSFSAKTYSWVGRLADEPEVRATTKTDGLTSAVVTIDGTPRTAVLKDNVHSAALLGAEWKSIDEVSHDPAQVSLAVWMANWAKRPPAHNVQQWIANVNGVTAGPAGQYTGNYDPDAVVRLLGGKHKGTTVADAHGTVAVTIKDGYVTQAERHLTGTVTTSDGTKAVDRRESYSLSDYNTATPDVPAEARQAVAK